MLSHNDIDLIKYFKNTISILKYGRKIQYQLIEKEQLLNNNEHIINISRMDNDYFIVKLIYKLSLEDIKNLK